MAYQRIEVLTGDERRRSYTAAEKTRMVEEAFRPSVVVTEAARRFGVHESLLYRWRRLMTAGGAITFVPVTVTPEPASEEAPLREPEAPASAPLPATAPAPPPPSDPTAGPRPMVEIALPGGARVRLDGAVDPALATAVLAALAPSRRAP